MSQECDQGVLFALHSVSLLHLYTVTVRGVLFFLHLNFVLGVWWRVRVITRLISPALRHTGKTQEFYLVAVTFVIAENVVTENAITKHQKVSLLILTHWMNLCMKIPLYINLGRVDATKGVGAGRLLMPPNTGKINRTKTGKIQGILCLNFCGYPA